MQDDVRRLQQHLRTGQCCAEALVRMGLERTGGENPQLLQAVRGLCGGVRDGMLCGALTGAACMLSLVEPRLAEEALVPELSQWFRAAMTAQFGGCDCADIAGDDPAARAARCPAVVEATYLQAQAILRNHGHGIP
jgi:hypothetical protein